MPVGKTLENWPPSIWAGLKNLRPCLDAVPSQTFPLPQQNPQRVPFWGFARFCSSDGGHAGIADPVRKAVWLPITKDQKFSFTPAVAPGGFIGFDQVPTEHWGNLIVCENSTASSRYTPWTDKTLIAPSIESMIKSGWESPTTPIINIVGMGDGLAAAIQSESKAIAVSTYAITVRGSSNSTAPWQVHLLNAAGAMPASTLDALKAKGILCATLEAIAKVIVPYVFPNLQWICGTAPPLNLTAEQHVTLATAMAKRANEWHINEPVPVDPADAWAKANPSATLSQAWRAGWNARGQ